MQYVLKISLTCGNKVCPITIFNVYSRKLWEVRSRSAHSYMKYSMWIESISRTSHAVYTRSFTLSSLASTSQCIANRTGEEHLIRNIEDNRWCWMPSCAGASKIARMIDIVAVGEIFATIWGWYFETNFSGLIYRLETKSYVFANDWLHHRTLSAPKESLRCAQSYYRKLGVWSNGPFELSILWFIFRHFDGWLKASVHE